MKIKLLFTLLTFTFVSLINMNVLLAQSTQRDQDKQKTSAEHLLLSLEWYKLVSLDMLDSLYEVHHYTLNSQEL